jgi:hypothetical protein
LADYIGQTDRNPVKNGENGSQPWLKLESHRVFTV